MNCNSIESVQKGSVTLRDIARELDLSHVSVSLALRNNPRISESTRVRVKQKAEEMGYFRDPMLSALSHYQKNKKHQPRQSVLAWINPVRVSSKLEQREEFNLYRKGATEAARQLGLTLEECTPEEFSPKQMDAGFKKRGIRGVVIAPVTDLAAPIDWSEFPWQDYSAIRFDRNLDTPSMHFVTSAQVVNAVLACKKIRKKGYQRIGFVGAGDERRLFVAGYLRCQYALPEDRRLPPLLDGDGGLTLEELDYWMKENNPDAILTDLVALPSMLAELGVSIPQDVGVATLNLHGTPINAGIDQNPEEIGRTVIRLLACQLNEHHFGIPAVRNSIQVDGQWVDGSMLPDRS